MYVRVVLSFIDRKEVPLQGVLREDWVSKIRIEQPSYKYWSDEKLVCHLFGVW